jgi:multiple antibiotic resistance protein
MGAVFDVNEFIKYVGALIALLDPISAVPLMLALTPGYTSAQRTKVAIVASITVLVVLLVASWLGQEILAFFAISVELFRVAGGLLILLIAISMIMPGSGGPHTMPALANPEHNPAIVPLGIPLIAGPGAIATAVLFANHPHPQWSEMTAHAAAIGVATLATLGCLLAAAQIERFIGPTGTRVATQVMGLILAAVGIEMIVGGLQDHFGVEGLSIRPTPPSAATSP